MARRPSNPDHGKGFADLSGGVAQKHPFERPLFQALLRAGGQDALEVLDRKKELVTLQPV